MLELNSLSCGYGFGDVVHDVSLKVKEGERLCVLGPNGCGKTTLLRALSGIIPYRGSARLFGKEIRDYSRRELSGYVALFSQISQVSFGYSVYDTVAMGRYLKAKGAFGSSADDKTAVMGYIERLGLKDIMDKQVTELSGGQLQRVFLARTFVQEPKLILLDEPVNHLDISYQIALIDLIIDWVSMDGSRAVIGVIHELNLCPTIFERGLLMDGGRAVMDAGISDVLKSKQISAVYDVDVSGYMKKSFEFWK